MDAMLRDRNVWDVCVCVSKLLTDYTRFVSCGCQVDCIAICFSRASSILWMVELSFQLHFALVDAKWNVSQL